jgi:transcriptional regulator with XRE-family HTH domain
MVERIRLLLETRQLSPTQFADAIGIARPIVSHILSGRNKPSLEVVQRILAAMPDLSMPWLLNGTGSMLARQDVAPVPHEAPAPNPQPVEPVKAPTLEPTVKPQPVVVPAEKAVKTSQSFSQNTTESLKKPELGPNAIPKRFTPNKPGSLLDSSKVEKPISQPVPTVEPVSVSDPLPASPVAAESASAAATNSAAQLIAGSDKPIRRIVIFYRDGSFADFQPE